MFDEDDDDAEEDRYSGWAWREDEMFLIDDWYEHDWINCNCSTCKEWYVGFSEEILCSMRMMYNVSMDAPSFGYSYYKHDDDYYYYGEEEDWCPE